MAEGLAPSLHDELTRVLFALAVVVLLARVAGQLAVAWKLPPVLGELFAGVLVGNLTVFELAPFAFIRDDVVLEVLAQVGVVLLLFEVGLKSELRELLSVGASALRVAGLGVVAPFLMGYGTSAVFLPGADPLVHVFVGATLSATSVGISARVLEDLGRVRSKEGRIILGAAVVDDVLGLVILGVVSALASQRASGVELGTGALLLPLAKAALFFAVVVPIGLYVSPHIAATISHPATGGVVLGSALFLCFSMAALANAVGLAAIVGAFAAGIAMDSAQFGAEREQGLEELIEPLVALFAPLFFVVVGMRVDLAQLMRGEVLGLAVVLTLVAIVGKQICALGVRENGISRLAVGLGMVPRGEVGMIFAGAGAATLLDGRPVLDAGLYAALITAVFATTVVTPPVLATVLARATPRD